MLMRLVRSESELTIQLCSPSVSSSLHSGDVKKGKELIAEHSLALKEKRLTDLLNEIKALKQG